MNTLQRSLPMDNGTLFDHDVMMARAEGDLSSERAWSVQEVASRERSAYDFWNEYIDEANRAYLKILRLVPLDRILALDPLGDGFFPVLHILVEFADTTGPFTSLCGRRLLSASEFGQNPGIDPSEKTRRRIFPEPLPSPPDPEPKQFDDTSNHHRPLSTASSERLTMLLAKRTEKNFNVEEDAEAAESRDEQNRRKVQEFQQWRDNIAHPVFSSFVNQFRASGHRARVRIRSASSAHGSETIELRVRLNVSPHYNPSGHLRISMSVHSLGGWQMDVSPPSSQAKQVPRTPRLRRNNLRRWC